MYLYATVHHSFAILMQSTTDTALTYMSKNSSLRGINHFPILFFYDVTLLLGSHFKTAAQFTGYSLPNAHAPIVKKSHNHFFDFLEFFLEVMQVCRLVRAAWTSSL